MDRLRALVSDGGLVPQAVLGVDEGGSARPGHGERHQAAERRRCRAGGRGATSKRPRAEEPPQAAVQRRSALPAAPRPWTGTPAASRAGDEGVLVGEDVGDLVVESLPVPGAHHVDEETLGAAEAEALDEQRGPGARGPAVPVAGLPPSHGPMVPGAAAGRESAARR